MNHIMLIGFMGCGKTSVGKKLAEHMQLPFIDMDAQIVEQMGMPVAEIFTKYGESYFRDLETELLKKLSNMSQQTVISTGGGMPVQPQNLEYMKEIGMVVLLKTSMDILVKRLSHDTTRPVIQGGDLRQKIAKLQSERNPIYEQVCNVQVTTDGKSFEEIVREIQKLALECKKMS